MNRKGDGLYLLKSLTFLALIISLILFVYATPQISFVSPTLDNASSTANSSINVNVSITELNLNNFIWNWNSTNYTFYEDNLVLMMNFENKSSLGENDTHVVDLSKYSNNGTIIGGALFNSSGGKYGGSFEFNGDDYIFVSGGYTNTLKGDDTHTISYWIKPNTHDTNGAVHIDMEDQDLGYLMQWNQNNNLFWYVGGTGRSYTPSPSISLGNWYYFSFVKTGVTTGNFYINGELQSSYSGNFNATPDVASDLLIGKYHGGASWDLNGTIDEVRIYNRSLSAEEIYELYHSNLYKYSDSEWEFYINQSENKTLGLDLGSYSYYAFASDNSNNGNMTDIRIVTIIDQDSPNVNLTSPENNSTWNSSSIITFIYNVTDLRSNISNCSLYINGTLNQTDTDILNNTNQSFSAILPDGYYNWSISCLDSANNLGSSSTFNITVAYALQPPNITSKKWLIIGDRFTKTDAMLLVNITTGISVTNASINIIGTNLTENFSKNSSVLWIGEINISTLTANTYQFNVTITNGTANSSSNRTFYISYPLYVAWTSDWESSYITSDKLSSINSTFIAHPYAKLTMLLNPWHYINDSSNWSLLKNWSLARKNNYGDEIGLHLHMYKEFVENSSVIFKNDSCWWAYTSDCATGYNMALWGYNRTDIDAFLNNSINIFQSQGLGTPKSFRAPGWTANTVVLSSLNSFNFLVDSSPIERATIGSLNLNWTGINNLSQPYYSSTTNKSSSIPTPTLSLLEVPNNGESVDSINETTLKARFDLNYNLSNGVLSEKRTIVYLFHPHDWSSSEGTNGTLSYIDSFLYNNDNGSVIYVTLSNLATAFDIGTNITLLNLTDGYSLSYPNSFNLSYFINGSTVDNCSLYLNGILNQTNTNITKDITEKFILNNLTSGNYNWNINCTDFFNNMSSSETRTFTVNLPSSSSSTSSPSSGWGKADLSTYLINGQQFTEGYTKTLSENNKINFKINSELHSLEINKILNNTIKIIVSSEPIEATLLIGDERKFELTNDSYYDLYVKLNSIDNEKANLTIKSINETITPETIKEEEKKEDIVEEEHQKNIESENIYNRLILMVIIFVVLIIISLLYIYKKKFKRH